jgi:hypothetical protein
VCVCVFVVKRVVRMTRKLAGPSLLSISTLLLLSAQLIASCACVCVCVFVCICVCLCARTHVRLRWGVRASGVEGAGHTHTHLTRLGSTLMAGVMLGLGYADFSHEHLFRALNPSPPEVLGASDTTTRTAIPRGHDDSGAEPTTLKRLPHTLLALAGPRRRDTHAPLQASEDSTGSSAGCSSGSVRQRSKIRVLVLTQATHSYYAFVRGLALSLDAHLASVPIPPGAAPELNGPSAPEYLDVHLVVFTDNTDTNEHTITAGLLSHLHISHRYVEHYGWPALALRRWETYLTAESSLRDADIALHIDVDARVVSSLLPLLLSSASFGVLHADNAYYTGAEVATFDPASWQPLRTRHLPGFLGGAHRQKRRGYFDQACLPDFCCVEPPYERRCVDWAQALNPKPWRDPQSLTRYRKLPLDSKSFALLEALYPTRNPLLSAKTGKTHGPLCVCACVRVCACAYEVQGGAAVQYVR